MALTEDKLEYHRNYREANKEKVSASYKRWHEANGKQRYYENLGISRAIKRKCYYMTTGNLAKADQEQKLIDELRLAQPRKQAGPKTRLTAEERAASAKRIVRRYRYKHVKGIPTLDAPDACEVCGSTIKISLDHCHKTQRFRGWLCDSCNIVLGRVKDDIGILAALISYLEKHKGED